MIARQVGVIGLGLIGASLGLALGRRLPSVSVVGYDVDSSVARQAERSGAIARTAGSIQEACRGSDIVVLAPPVSAILALIPQLTPHLEPGTLVTDTGGTKTEIVAKAEAALGTDAVAFVGGHPLAGRLRSGVNEPDADLFADCTYCLTPTPLTPALGVERAAQPVEA